LKKINLSKYLEGKISSTEREELEKFIESNEVTNEAFDKAFEEFWNENKDYSKDEVFSGVLFNEITSRIKDNTFLSKYQAKKSFRLLKYAATITVFFSFIIYFLQDQLLPVKLKPLKIEMVLKQTSKGQKSTIMLSDGSKVILNSESQISHPKKFSDSTRIISLTGEAYFEVARDLSRPFSVISNGVKTTALGTSFNVNSRMTAVKVSLATGKVVVENELKKAEEKNSHFLKPGEAITYEAKSNKVDISKFNIEKDFLWKDGILYFDNAQFDEIKDKLETWYNIEFDVNNQQLANKKFTGRFDNQSLKSVMESIGFTIGFDYFVNGKKVKVIFNK
jgi:transmembrane sensor